MYLLGRRKIMMSDKSYFPKACTWRIITFRDYSSSANYNAVGNLSQYVGVF